MGEMNVKTIFKQEIKMKQFQVLRNMIVASLIMVPILLFSQPVQLKRLQILLMHWKLQVLPVLRFLKVLLMP